MSKDLTRRYTSASTERAADRGLDDVRARGSVALEELAMLGELGEWATLSLARRATLRRMVEMSNPDAAEEAAFLQSITTAAQASVIRRTASGR